MKTAVFSSKKYDERFFEEANQGELDIVYFEMPLNPLTATTAKDYPCVCAFVNDQLNRDTLTILASGKTRLIAMRCAGYNNIDIEAARELGLTIVRVPAYSPEAVAEHVIAMLLTLYRTTHRSFNRVREGNFSLDGLVGDEVFGKTVGIIGTGKIGELVAERFSGFGCKRLAYDIVKNPKVEAMGVDYVSLETIWQESDIITLHCPLLADTKHMINQDSIEKMVDGVTIINTSRGALLDTHAVFKALKSRKIAYLGIDVYEEEENLFFEDLSAEIIQDDLFMRLTTFPNVLITGHQAFFTKRALTNIAQTTIANIKEFGSTGHSKNIIKLD